MKENREKGEEKDKWGNGEINQKSENKGEKRRNGCGIERNPEKRGENERKKEQVRKRKKEKKVRITRQKTEEN